MTKLIRLPLLAGALVALAGCGGEETGSAAGKVTLDGKPVVAGSVSFMVAGVAYPADIQPGGDYTTGPMPVGEAAVMVYDPPSEAAQVQVDKAMMELIRQGKMAPPKPKPPVVPPQYSDQARTPLKTTIKSGVNTFNIELKK